jgi:ABC-type branched-subunit amino acid transport system ATPase component
VFCAAVLGGALLGSPGLRLFRATPAWCAGALAGLGAAGAVTGWLAERPGTALAVCAIVGAALLVPSATDRRDTGDRWADPHPGADADEGKRGRRPATGVSWNGRVDAAVLGAGGAAAFFAAQDLLVFRRLELGGSPAALTAVAAAAAVVPVLAAAPLLRSGRTGREAQHTLRTLPLLLLAVAAASTALAASADTSQLVISLALTLGCSAAGMSTLGSAGLRDNALPALLGGLAGIGALALAGRPLSAGNALVLMSVVPLSRAALLLRAARPASGTRTEPRAGNAVVAALEVTDLTVRHRDRPRATRLRLSVAPGELVVLHDELPGRRAGAVLRALGGVRGPSHGRYRIFGHDLTSADAPTRWRLGVCALLDPQDGTARHGLPQLASTTSVSAALRTAVAALDPARADEVCRAVRVAFPVLEARGEDRPAALEPAERCVLGLALTLVTRPRLLLLDLTGSGVLHLASDPEIADLLRRITSQGTAVLVAAARQEPALGGRAVGLSTGRRAPRTRPLPRMRKVST